MDKKKKGFARLMELAGQKRRKVIIACVLSVIASAVRIIPYFTIYGIIQLLLECYIEPQSISKKNVYILVIITFVAALIYGVCAYFSSAIAHTAAYDIIFELRMKLMDKLGRLPSGFFSATTQGSIKKILSDDTEQVEVFAAHHLCDIAAAIATPIFTLIYLFVMDWRMGIMSLVPIIISMILLVMCLSRPDKAALQVEMHDTQEAMQGTIVEYIHGMSVIKIFGRNHSAFKKYENDINAFVNSVEKTAKANAMPMGAYYAFFGAQLLFLLPMSICLLMNTSSYMDYLPVVFLFLLVGGGLKEPLESMMQMVILSGRITEGVKRIDDILYAQEMQDGCKQTPTNYDVKFQDVSFSYGNDIMAINQVNFTLKQGTVTGLVGPSGGGKSTLVQLLLRFYDVNDGSICIGNTDIRDLSQKTLSDLISYVFQDNFIFHDTVGNNIRMGNRNATNYEVEQAAKNAGIHEVIMALPKGYDTVIGEKDTFLSGGEKQRLAIARVFLKNSPIVVLDEATAYADAENETKIQEAFAKLAKNKTVIIIAHRLKTIQSADNILVMKNGRIVGEGVHEKLLDECSVYKDMVTANERRDQWTVKKREAV